MEVECHWGMMAHKHIIVGNNSYEKVKTFRYLGSLLTTKNCIQEEIKCRLKAGNSFYYSVQTLLFSQLLSGNLKIKIYKIIILPIVLYDCETWSLTLTSQALASLYVVRQFITSSIGKWPLDWLREECRLKSWGEYLGPRGMDMGSGENFSMRNFIVFTVPLI